MAAVLNPFYQQTVKTGRLWPIQMERVKRSRIGEKRRELENSLSHCVFACKLSRSERACLTRAAAAAGCISPEIGNFLFSALHTSAAAARVKRRSSQRALRNVFRRRSLTV